MNDLPWRRDVGPAEVCTCTHDRTDHRTDLRRITCDRGGCDCPAFALVAFRWREHRTVTEPATDPGAFP